jgi:hypothetical protein
MTRTTLDLDPSVLQELRQRAEMEDKSMGAMASELLAGALATRPTRHLGPLRWASHELGAPRASLGDKEAMSALMDEAPRTPRRPGRGEQ